MRDDAEENCGDQRGTAVTPPLSKLLVQQYAKRSYARSNTGRRCHSSSLSSRQWRKSCLNAALSSAAMPHRGCRRRPPRSARASARRNWWSRRATRLRPRRRSSGAAASARTRTAARRLRACRIEVTARAPHERAVRVFARQHQVHLDAAPPSSRIARTTPSFGAKYGFWISTSRRAIAIAIGVEHRYRRDGVRRRAAHDVRRDFSARARAPGSRRRPPAGSDVSSTHSARTPIAARARPAPRAVRPCRAMLGSSPLPSQVSATPWPNV